MTRSIAPSVSGRAGLISIQPRILIIDDDPALLDGLTGMLQLRLGDAHVDTCSSPAAAIEMTRRYEYDLILCDISMPVMNGFTLLPWLRHSAPHARIVMMSGVAEEWDQESAATSGATMFLAKPFDRDALTLTLQQLLRQAVAH